MVEKSCRLVMPGNLDMNNTAYNFSVTINTLVAPGIYSGFIFNVQDLDNYEYLYFSYVIHNYMNLLLF